MCFFKPLSRLYVNSVYLIYIDVNVIKMSDIKTLEDYLDKKSEQISLPDIAGDKRHISVDEKHVENKKSKTNTDDLEEGEIPVEKQGIRKGVNFDEFNRKRKVALLLGYYGANYHGMQKNPDVDTIELKLLEALCKIKAIKPEHKHFYLESNDNQLSFQRAARTDKGVSAVRQVVSLKIVAEESFIKDVNRELPPDIRVFGLERVTKKFDAKCSCSGRSYEYLIPSYAFAPSKLMMSPRYRITDDQHKNVSNLFKRYVGTHNFHNFTSGKHFKDKSSIRYITDFKLGEPFIHNENEFMSISINGQSFMIHQIRKMIGLVIAISRGYCGDDIMEKAFQEVKLDIPKAPGLGLLLNNVYFKQYNKKFGKDGVHRPLTFEEAQSDVEDFKRNCIWKNILDEEIQQESMIAWLKTLSNHTYKEAGMSTVVGGGEKGCFPPNSISCKVLTESNTLVKNINKVEESTASEKLP